MHILILGGTGRTGQQIITHALSQDHTITAFVRSSSTASLPTHPNLTILTGSVTSAPDILNALRTPIPADAIIISLASVRKSNSPFSASISPPRLMTDAHIAVIQAARDSETGLKRIVTISAFGVGSSKEYVWWPLRWVLFQGGMKVGMDDHNAVEEVVRREGEKGDLEWTLVRPAMLSDGSGKEVRVFGEMGEGTGMVEKVSRESVARFVVGSCVEKGEWVGKTPVIGE